LLKRSATGSPPSLGSRKVQNVSQHRTLSQSGKRTQERTSSTKCVSGLTFQSPRTYLIVLTTHQHQQQQQGQQGRQQKNSPNNNNNNRNTSPRRIDWVAVAEKHEFHYFTSQDCPKEKGNGEGRSNSRRCVSIVIQLCLYLLFVWVSCWHFPLTQRSVSR